jgi:EAL domain-containing protein (putative c-di-GMP-specific phosphodiesterase class I)
MDVAFVSRVQGGRRVFECVDTIAGFSPIAVGDSDMVEDTYCGRVLDGRLPVLVVDASQEPAVADISATWDLPIGTHLSVPVHTGTGVYGTLCCFSRSVMHDITSADIGKLRVFADIVGKHLQPLVDRTREASDMQARLSEVLDDGGPQIALQPIVDLATDTVCGYEALARFPAREGWGPQEWFDAAARVGLGAALESAAVYNALRLLPRLAPGQSLAVNVSARALLSSLSIPAMLTSQAAGRLVLEITEHERITDHDRLNACVSVARAAGVRIAVDDAGSGFAGLQHILALAPEVLKLDRSLISAVATDSARQAMCEAMVGFCRRTNTALIAEGVETHADLDTLRRLGITRAQGYLLGRPEIWAPNRSADDGAPLLRIRSQRPVSPSRNRSSPPGH